VHGGTLKGKELFHSSILNHAEHAPFFYKMMANMKRASDCAKPSPTHLFINALNQQGQLLRLYSQNIDGLETKAGLPSVWLPGGSKAMNTTNPPPRAVMVHGVLNSVRCPLCSSTFPWTEDYSMEFGGGMAPNCPECFNRGGWIVNIGIRPNISLQLPGQKRAQQQKRAIKVGRLRPDVVLYDENHPFAEEVGGIQANDEKSLPDLLIVMGTSLQVPGIKKLVKMFAAAVHHSQSSNNLAIFINKTRPAKEWDGVFDYYVEGETDEWVASLPDQVTLLARRLLALKEPRFVASTFVCQT
jgi:NAD-dependent histone deacetylase SIR2